MPEKDSLSDRKRGLEEEYFRKKEQELVEKMRQRSEREQDRRMMAEKTGVADEEALEALQELGYTADTVRLLHLVPLIQVAWAEGGVSTKERDMIFELAKSHGVDEGSEAHARLTQLLERKPDEEFFDNSLRAIRILLEALPEDQRQAGRENLVDYSTKIAAVSGGILGLGKISDSERELISKIASEIGQK